MILMGVHENFCVYHVTVNKRATQWVGPIIPKNNFGHAQTRSADVKVLVTYASARGR